MASDINYALRRLGYMWVTAGIIVAGLLAYFWYGPDLESRYNPVVTAQEHRIISAEGSEITFTVRLYKSRPCRLVDLDWYVTSGERATWVRVTRPDGSPVGADVTYPVGWRTIGPFMVNLPTVWRDADSLWGALTYDCHPGWLTTQLLGPVRLQ